MARATKRRVPAWRWFLAWFVVGAGVVLALLAALTIGPFVLPVVVLLTFWLATRRGSEQGLPGLLSGLSLPLLYVAYLNRDGPGNVCTISSTGSGCTEEWSPWPWFVVGALLLLGGVLLFNRLQRTRGVP